MAKQHFTFHASETPVAFERAALFTPNSKLIEEKIGPNDYKFLAIYMFDEDDVIVGGMNGYTQFGWLFVEILFVSESLRGFGLGRTIMNCAETVTKERGCHSVWLDTHQSQARPFYEKLGYKCFAELENHPGNTSLFLMKKKL
jgi:GNAT superfamily N-acetyltransferase